MLQNLRLYLSMCSINNRVYYCHGFCLFNITIVYPFVLFIDVFAYHISVTSLVDIFLRLFSSWFLYLPLLQSFCIICLKLPPCLVHFFHLNSCDDIPVRYLLFYGYLCVYNRICFRALSDAKQLHPL